MSAKFKVHGQFKNYVDGRILVTDVIGPWNKEMVDSCALEMDPLARALSATGPYVGMVIVRESILCPPDAMDAMRRVIEYGSRHLASVGNALVADRTVEGRALLEPLYGALYAAAPAYRLFDDVDSARAWSLELLANHGY